MTDRTKALYTISRLIRYYRGILGTPMDDHTKGALEALTNAFSLIKIAQYGINLEDFSDEELWSLIQKEENPPP